MKNAHFRIGEVATRVGVTIDTLRYYERVGLLPPASRTSGGFRLFDDTSIERVLFIKEAKNLGFTLIEIKELLTTGGVEECKRVRDLLKRKISELDVRLEAMNEFRLALSRQLSECERELRLHGREACCPVVTTTRKRAQSK
jgi:DNA-binding transcriptional MerR regulator